jgi:hypothetical protein
VEKKALKDRGNDIVAESAYRRAATDIGCEGEFGVIRSFDWVAKSPIVGTDEPTEVRVDVVKEGSYDVAPIINPIASGLSRTGIIESREDLNRSLGLFLPEDIRQWPQPKGGSDKPEPKGQFVVHILVSHFRKGHRYLGGKSQVERMGPEKVSVCDCRSYRSSAVKATLTQRLRSASDEANAGSKRAHGSGHSRKLRQSPPILRRSMGAPSATKPAAVTRPAVPKPITTRL